MAGALIVTAELGEAEFACLDALRRAHFPPERNHLRAHLTMFHALPPSSEDAIRRSLARCAGQSPPPARLSGLIDLGGGVAYRVESADLEAIRADLAEQFHGCLTAQDASKWQPHVTIQNKVRREEATALLSRLSSEFRAGALRIRGLELHRYLGGPWEFVGRWRFRV